MNCSLHPSRDALGTCRRCGRATCELCTKFVDAMHYCTTCGIQHVRSKVFRVGDRIQPSRRKPAASQWRTGPVSGSLLVVACCFLAYQYWPPEWTAAIVASHHKARTGVTDAVVATEMATLRRAIDQHLVISAGRLPEDMEAFAASHLDIPRGRTPGRDPFQNIYLVEPVGKDGDYRLRSMGRDRVAGTDDDIVVE